MSKMSNGPSVQQSTTDAGTLPRTDVGPKAAALSIISGGAEFARHHHDDPAVQAAIKAIKSRRQD